MQHPPIPENLKNGDLIGVKHKCIPNLPSRRVTYENGGIRIGEHWFRWNYFFEVNYIVKQNETKLICQYIQVVQPMVAICE